MRNQEKNKKSLLKYSLPFFAFLFFFLPKIVGAELSLADIKTTIQVSPKNPGAYQNVLLSISSPFIELDKAEITWSLDTKIALKGIGAKDLNFKTGAVGSINKIGVVIRVLDGNIIYKDIIIIPSDVDMLWESYTYTPPFYKGKALDTQESLIKIVAIPHIVDTDGNKLSSENLVYKWKTKGELRKEASGFGKNVYVFRNGIVPVLETVEVEVSSIDGTSLANKSLTLTITDTKPIIYQNDPLLGVLFNRTLTGTININSVGGNEIRLSAYPFFFSIIKNKEEIDYSWKMNRKTLNINSDSVVFTKPTTAGSSQIELRATGDLSIFQRGYVGFSIDFDEE